MIIKSFQKSKGMTKGRLGAAPFDLTARFNTIAGPNQVRDGFQPSSHFPCCSPNRQSQPYWQFDAEGERSGSHRPEIRNHANRLRGPPWFVDCHLVDHTILWAFWSSLCFCLPRVSARPFYLFYLKSQY